MADDGDVTGDDLLYIVSATPSDRSTDTVLRLPAPYNIDDDAAEYLYAGSVTQDGGDTVYYGLRVIGSVNLSTTQLMVIQDGELKGYDTPTNLELTNDFYREALVLSGLR